MSIIRFRLVNFRKDPPTAFHIVLIVSMGIKYIVRGSRFANRLPPSTKDYLIQISCIKLIVFIRQTSTTSRLNGASSPSLSRSMQDDLCETLLFMYFLFHFHTFGLSLPVVMLRTEPSKVSEYAKWVYSSLERN